MNKGRGECESGCRGHIGSGVRYGPVILIRLRKGLVGELVGESDWAQRGEWFFTATVFRAHGLDHDFRPLEMFRVPAYSRPFPYRRENEQSSRRNSRWRIAPHGERRPDTGVYPHFLLTSPFFQCGLETTRFLPTNWQPCAAIPTPVSWFSYAARQRRRFLHCLVGSGCPVRSARRPDSRAAHARRIFQLVERCPPLAR